MSERQFYSTVDMETGDTNRSTSHTLQLHGEKFSATVIHDTVLKGLQIFIQ